MHSACCNRFFCETVTEKRKRGQNTTRTTAPEAKHASRDKPTGFNEQFTNPVSPVHAILSCWETLRREHFETPVGFFRVSVSTVSGLESSMNSVQIEQKSYEMPPRDGFTVAHFLTVADIDRSARFYETVFGARILSRGDSNGAPGYIQIANAWLIIN